MTAFKTKALNFFLYKKKNMNHNNIADPAAKLLADAREIMNDDTPEGFTMEKKQTDKGVKYQLVTKNGDSKHKKAVLYLHGGAYISGLTNQYRKLAPRFYNVYGGADIFYLDYKLAPEHKYPSQLDEAYEMWLELVEKQNYNPKDIFVLGDSAGAHLTVSLLFKLRDEGKEMPVGAACFSLWGDMLGTGESYINNYGIDVIFGEKRKKMTEDDKKNMFESNLYAFIGNEDRKNPYISPVFGDFNGFPPMFFSVGSAEILLDDSLTVAKKLKAAGVRAECDIQPDMFHTFTLYAERLPKAKASFEKLEQFMKSL